MTYQKTATLLQITYHWVQVQTSLQPQGKTCDNCTSIDVIEIRVTGKTAKLAIQQTERRGYDSTSKQVNQN